MPATDVLVDVAALAKDSPIVRDMLSLPDTAQMSAVQMLSGFKRGAVKVGFD